MKELLNNDQVVVASVTLLLLMDQLGGGGRGIRCVELVVFIDCKRDIPSAAEALWYDNKISSSKLHRLHIGIQVVCVFGVHLHFPTH